MYFSDSGASQSHDRPKVAVSLRAKRYVMPIPMTYRRTDDEHWFNGRVVNVSETGILFQPADLPIGASIEMIVALPVGIGSMGAGKQVCLGQVVRTTDAGAAAASFTECRFLLEP